MSRGRQVPQADSSAARGDDPGCTSWHGAMDAFYASVELIAQPALVGTPVLVGGGTNRGVVLSATYEARALGVRSAMPVTQAHRICPQATILTPHMSRYSQVSKAVMEIFKSFTPYVEPLSLDEAFLDVSGALRRVGSAAHIGDLIRARVQSEQGITCSVGVATSKFVAKLATNAAKPDGLFVVPADQVLEFLHPLPVGALWGVGAKTEEQLKRLGLNTVREVAHTPEKTLQRALGKATGEHLYALAWGKDDRSVVPDAGERSIGAEHTFEQDVDDPAILHREILRLATRVAARLRKQGLVGRTVSIKVRFADFTTITRSKTLNEPTDLSREISQAAQALYEALGLQRARLRLVGVRIEGVAPVAGHSRQLILDAPDQGWPEAERAIDAAVARFGPDVVKPATLIDPDAAH